MVQYEDSQGRVYIEGDYYYDYYYYYGSPIRQNQYTLERLTLGEVYNITVQVWIRPTSACYSYIFGEFSDPVFVETVETGSVK